MIKEKQSLNQLEAQRVAMLNLYGRMTTEQLRFKPGPQSWNLLQVLSHIVTAEKQSLILIQRRIGLKQPPAKSGLGSAIRYGMLKTALFLPIKFKAPKIAEVHEENPDLEWMRGEWESLRSELKRLVDETDKKILGGSVYKHPRAGLLNMNQALGFMMDHIAHHLKQVERIQNHPSFPSSGVS